MSWSAHTSAVARVPEIGSATIESFKWLALVLMLAEHWMRYVVGSLPPWIYACGRIVLPLFAFALALGLRAQPLSKLRTVLLRLFAWGIVAQATLQFVDAPERQLNVLFTFGFGLAAVYGFERVRSPLLRALGLAAIGAAAIWCEFGPAGVAFVAATIALARADEPPPLAAWLAVAGVFVALAVPNGDFHALMAAPVAWLVWRSGIRMPRLRGAFYWAYALQFPLYAGVRMATG